MPNPEHTGHIEITSMPLANIAEARTRLAALATSEAIRTIVAIPPYVYNQSYAQNPWPTDEHTTLIKGIPLSSIHDAAPDLLHFIGAGIDLNTALVGHNEPLAVSDTLHLRQVQRSRELLALSFAKPLRRYSARLAQRRGVPQQGYDIYQAGMVGMMEAIDRLAQSEDLSNIGAYVIKSAIGKCKLEALFQQLGLRVEPTFQKKLYQYWRVYAGLYTKSMRDPTISELAQELDIPEDEVHFMQGTSRRFVPLDAISNDPDMRERLLHDSQTEVDVVKEYVGNHEKYKNLIERGFELLGTTSKKTRALRLMYGYVDGCAHSFEEVGALMEVPKPSIFPVIYSARDELRDILTKLENNTIDFKAWRQKYPRRKGAQVFLALIDEPFTNDQTLTELRQRACDLVEQASNLSSDEKDVIIQLYGLTGKDPETVLDLACAWPMPGGPSSKTAYIASCEKQALSKLCESITHN